jgi:hypothetical protein
MTSLKKNKWLIHWLALGIIITLFILIAIFLEDKQWTGNVLQTLGTIAGIYLTIIIFLSSKEDSNLQFIHHLEHLQELNTKQINALQELTEKQVRALQETNAAQIATLQDLTKKQIDALHKSTYEQISSFEHQLGGVVNKLSDSSILLGEILGRELEKSIDLFSNAVTSEEAKYNSIAEWKLLRTDAEKQVQLTKQQARIQNLRRGLDYLTNKYNNLKRFLGFGTNQLGS